MTKPDRIKSFCSGLAAMALLAGCTGASLSDDNTSAAQDELPGSAVTFQVEYQKFTLPNGLDVVMHVDASDPIVAINLTAHVGSARELPGRTGFAHLFEHLLFQDSENLGYGGLDKMSARIGGSINGFTTTDMTQYFQSAPKDALEKLIWAESEKLGYFINTVTQPVLDKERQVVKNEKRQVVDNRPYGHTPSVILNAMYPSDHPYSWTVIGSLEDLDAATLDDVKSFFRRWYVPNNVTVTISGDFDPVATKALVEKYFGEIARGEDITPYGPRPAVLADNMSFLHEDNFARVPQLTLAWPAVERYHPDAAALQILLDYLSNGKRAPLYEVLVSEQNLTSAIRFQSNLKEIAGEMYLTINAKRGEDLDDLLPAIEEAFERFEQSGISQADLDRIKAGIETDFYSSLQGALGKAIALSQYNTFAGEPGYITQDIDNTMNVSIEDVDRVYRRYIKDRFYVATSFVPRGQIELALSDAVVAEIVEEEIVIGAEKDVPFDPTVRNFETTTSSFDRSVEPPFGDAFIIPEPAIWRDTLDNGLRLVGTTSNEVPLVYFSLKIDAGLKRADIDNPFLAEIAAAMLHKGTLTKTPVEFEDRIKSLGSNITVASSDTDLIISGRTLTRNFSETLALVEEIIVEPRWDTNEFELVKQKLSDQIDVAKSNPSAVARLELSKLRYANDNILNGSWRHNSNLLESVQLADVQQFFRSNAAPGSSQFFVAGDIKQEQVKQSLRSLNARWSSDPQAELILPGPLPVEQSRIYLYDVPGAAQSVLLLGAPSIPVTHPDYPLAQAMNFLLGGNFSSRLNQELRVNKGYTYGIGSSYSGGRHFGVFEARTSVRSNITLEAMETIKTILSEYGASFTEQDLTVTKSGFLRRQAGANETLVNKLSLLEQITEYGLSDDFRTRDAERIRQLTVDDVQRLAGDLIDVNQMNWVVVGDAKTQEDRLEALGFGEVIRLGQ